MKKFNLGFTLAEVLITLSIIGVISAVVMPSVISSYQFKTIGVKLSKFASTVETAARSYVVQNDSFNPEVPEDLNDFINETFVFKSVNASVDGRGRIVDLGKDKLNAGYIIGGKATKEEGSDKEEPAKTTPDAYGYVAVLKDGTSLNFKYFSTLEDKYSGTAHEDVIKIAQVGFPVLEITFNPQVTGLPSIAQSYFKFFVTELGYVYPANDNCLWDLYSNDWQTNKKTFDKDTVCDLDNKGEGAGKNNADPEGTGIETKTGEGEQ